jgi:hypothetical protein
MADETPPAKRKTIKRVSEDRMPKILVESILYTKKYKKKDAFLSQAAWDAKSLR